MRWWWRRWRARHNTWLAYVDWYNEPSTESRAHWERAVIHEDQIDLDRP